jgi:hypothetical protein
MRSLALLVALAGCGNSHGTANPDAPAPDSSVADHDANPDAPINVSPLGLGTVSTPTPVTCPQGAPTGSTCEQVTVANCPGIEADTRVATIAILKSNATPRGTIVHFSGSDGTSFDGAGAQQYNQAGFLQVFTAWGTAWETTPASGIKTAGCRPATIIDWVFHEPTLHAASRALAFCGEGHSAGSGQLSYSLTTYGLAGELDYVNLISGPPFARIDLGCDGDAVQTAQVCNASVRTNLPNVLDSWENIQSPNHCGMTSVPAAELARWNNDSIAIGGTYSYPQTNVQFFDCTNQATAVTAMSQIFHDLIATAANNDPARIGYHCYSQADGCDVEMLGPQGGADAIAAMVAGCVPQHQ